MEILDMKCAEWGSKIGATADETTITKALGVLQEDGVYAFFIYLCSKGDAKNLTISDETFRFLKERRIFDNEEPIKKYKEYSATPNKETKKEKLRLYMNTLTDVIRTDLANDLDKLLFAKELLERALVYARYHAKALSISQSAPKGGEEVTAEEDK